MGITKNKPLLAGVGVVAAAFIAWLAFGFFGIQAAFTDTEVNETAEGLFDTQADSGTNETVSTDADEEADDAMEDEPAESDAETDDAMDDAETDDAMNEAMEDTDESTEEPVTNEIVTTFDGDFSSLNNYSVTGDAFVLSNGTDQRFLRFENFESSNGPDLKVYLRAANGDFVSLGDLSGNIGDQNYEIPADVDLTEFSRVEIWCERFSRGFGAAELAAV